METAAAAQHQLVSFWACMVKAGSVRLISSSVGAGGFTVTAFEPMEAPEGAPWPEPLITMGPMTTGAQDPEPPPGPPPELPEGAPGEFPPELPEGAPGEFPPELPEGAPGEFPPELPEGAPGEFPPCQP